MKKGEYKVKPSKMSIAVPRDMAYRLSYNQDFYAWTLSQVNLLKKGNFEKLDIDHLIEEITSLGRSERDKLERFLVIWFMHMLKVKYQPAKHTKSWDLTIKNSKHQASKVLKENPSLKTLLNNIVEEAYFSARLEAAIETGLEEKTFPEKCPWLCEELFPFLNKQKK